VLPATLNDYLGGTRLDSVSPRHEEVTRVETEVRERISRLLGVGGTRSVDSFHRELGLLMWDHCGMSRSREGLRKALDRIPGLRAEFWRDVRIPGDAGELFIRSSLEMDGYHHTDEQLTQHGAEWKSVGDVAYLDDEGYLYICDRKKDMIISGGVNIYPAEIEAVIHEHPAILDAAVFGIPDEEWGERVHAIVQARPGATIDLDELRAFVDERVGGYKRPRDYEVRDELPRTDSGKLLKRVLRDEYWKGRSSSV